jgi:hypothetical protein
MKLFFYKNYTRSNKLIFIQSITTFFFFDFHRKTKTEIIFMAIVIRRLKDTFECTQPCDEITRDQRIIGRRVLSTKKLICLPSYQGK